jgi:hypothetical protein
LATKKKKKRKQYRNKGCPKKEAVGEEAEKYG